MLPLKQAPRKAEMHVYLQLKAVSRVVTGQASRAQIPDLVGGDVAITVGVGGVGSISFSTL